MVTPEHNEDMELVYTSGVKVHYLNLTTEFTYQITPLID